MRPCLRRWNQPCFLGGSALSVAGAPGRLGLAGVASAASSGRQVHGRRLRRPAEHAEQSRGTLPACRSRRTLGRERLAPQPPAVGPGDAGAPGRARRGRARQLHLGEAGRAPQPRRAPSARSTSRADLRSQVRGQRRLALRPQPRRALLDDAAARDLRHARGRRARSRARTGTRAGRSGRSRRRGAASSSNIASVSVGKPAIRSAPNTMSGRSRRASSQKRDRIGARMPALHALEDHVVAGLQRQMQVRHQARLLGDRRASDARRPRPGRWRTGAGARSSGTWRRMCRTSRPSVISPGRSAP